MCKKLFLSPFFMPVAFVVFWLVTMGIIYVCCADNLLVQTKDGAIIDIFSKCGYLLLLGVLFVWSDDFSDKMRSWGIYIFFAVTCFLRESGVQHCLSTTDSTPFKSRFFLNPNNPLYEKIIYGILSLFVLGCVVYLAVKYAKYLVRSFFKFDTLTWSIAVLCTVGVVMKFIDRFPSNYKHTFHVRLSDEAYVLCQLMEESGEMFLPYIAIAILCQYHLLRRGTR